ncbi:GNAT family N-acetyltransferase [Nonomuraea sp. PA05]|uniref:GNAT family N-acetyltransferase n=1 Tax=Nonomuraea sp. PA05 TaxID=2604466 RepID=UPI0011D4F7AB|nr:GNAT family N-acetyltransferase [Nonomuraea sp. PA05]TYB62261.1 GNAT family N-acetyltransferase [Nonomuraea sp. PA05]
MIEVRRGSELGESHRHAITRIFVEGFGPDLVFFSKDPGKLTEALAHMLVLDLFHVGLVAGEPAGIVACTDGRQRAVRHDARELRRHLGLVRGTVAHFAFTRMFERPLSYGGERMASLEFVATGSRFRGQGVASAVIEHLLALPQYDEYVLDTIADINTPALRLYEKLGFTEFKRTKVHHKMITGIGAYVGMRLVKAP